MPKAKKRGRPPLPKGHVKGYSLTVELYILWYLGIARDALTVVGLTFLRVSVALLLREGIAVRSRIGCIAHNRVVQAGVDKSTRGPTKIAITSNHDPGDFHAGRGLDCNAVRIPYNGAVVDGEKSVALVPWVALMPEAAGLDPKKLRLIPAPASVASVEVVTRTW